MARDEDRNPELVCSCVAGGSQGVQIPKTYQDTRYTFHGFGDVNHEPVLELWEAENSILRKNFCLVQDTANCNIIVNIL